MSYESLNPPADIAADFESLEATIADDAKGTRVRRLYAYFKGAEEKCMEMKLRTTDFEQKQFADMLLEAFSASSRIVVAAWEKKHELQLSI